MGAKRRKRSKAAEPAPPEPDRALPSFRWGDEYNRYEAVLGEETIAWIWEGPKDLGGSSDQPIAAFLAFGPLETKAPASVVDALRRAIAERDPALFQDLRASAARLRNQKNREAEEKARRARAADAAAVARHREIRSWKDPWRSYENAPRNGPGNAARAPLASLLAPGALVFTAGAAIPLACEPSLPTLANYLALFLPVLSGFAAAWFWSRAALAGAGFFAIAGSVGALWASDAAFSGPIAEIAAMFGPPAAAYLAWIATLSISRLLDRS